MSSIIKFIDDGKDEMKMKRIPVSDEGHFQTVENWNEEKRELFVRALMNVERVRKRTIIAPKPYREQVLCIHKRLVRKHTLLTAHKEM